MASSATVGSAVIKLSFDGKGVKADLDNVEKETEKKSSGMASKIGGVMKKAAIGISAAFTGATAAVGGVIKASTNAYAEAEQLWGGAELMFGSAYESVMERANNAYKTVQMSQNEYLQQVNGFATGLKTALGGNEQAAADLADRIVTAEADIVSATGNSQENIQNAFNGIMKSNFTMLDNLQLGITPTKEGFQEVIDKVNEWNAANGRTTNYVIDNLADCQSALVDYVEMQGLAGYATNEASQTIQGSVASMKGAWENLMVGLANPGSNLNELVPQLVESVGTVVENLIPPIEEGIYSIGSVIGKLAPVIIQRLPELAEKIIPNLLMAAGNIVESLVAIIPSLLTTLMNSIVSYIPNLINMLANLLPKIITQLFNGLVQIIQGIAQMIPQIVPQIFGIVYQIINMLTQPAMLQQLLQAGFQLFMQLVLAIPQVISQLAEALPQIINNIVTFLTDPTTIKTLIKAAITLFFALVQAVPQILGALLSAFGSLVGSLWQGIANFFSSFAGQFGDKITGIFKGAINGVLSFIEGFINGPINLINGFVDVINGALGALGVNIGHIPNVSLPRLAKGGVVDGATAAVIGEAGQEAVLPLESNTGNWAGLLASTLAIEMEEQGSSGREINVYMTNEINSELDANEIGRIMVQSIRRAV